MTRFFLRRHKAPTESPDYWHEIVERFREHPLAAWQERHVAVVHSEAAGVALAACLNRQLRDGIVEGMTRYAWWAEGVQMVGTCGTKLSQAIEQLDRE